jgi:hypothetical protein
VRQGALYELTRHIRALNSVRVLSDLHGCIKQLGEVGISHLQPSTLRGLLP